MTPVRRPQPWLIRVSHWVNAVALVLMAGSGLEILAAYPAMGPRGQLYSWYPFQDTVPPGWSRIGGWLAGARHWHFAVAWLFVLNAVAYLLYLFLSGEWRRRLFLPRRDTRNAIATLAHYLRLRREAPEQGLYNGLQRFTYTGTLALGALVVLSGLALYKPVQLGRLTAIFGGYDPARALHLLVLVAFLAFTLMHITLVALHPRTFVEMAAGGRRAPVAKEDWHA